MVRSDGDPSVWLRRLVVLCGILAVTVVGLTALDKHDERTCRQNPALAAWTGYDPPLPVSDGGLWITPGSPPEQLPDVQSIDVAEICDGVLPW